MSLLRFQRATKKRGGVCSKGMLESWKKRSWKKREPLFWGSTFYSGYRFSDGFKGRRKETTLKSAKKTKWQLRTWSWSLGRKEKNENRKTALLGAPPQRKPGRPGFALGHSIHRTEFEANRSEAHAPEVAHRGAARQLRQQRRGAQVDVVVVAHQPLQVGEPPGRGVGWGGLGGKRFDYYFFEGSHFWAERKETGYAEDQWANAEVLTPRQRFAFWEGSQFLGLVPRRTEGNPRPRKCRGSSARQRHDIVGSSKERCTRRESMASHIPVLF